MVTSQPVIRWRMLEHRELAILLSLRFLYTDYLTKNGARYNVAIDDPNEKKYTGNEMALMPLQSEKKL
jgi:hypothetical protein